MSVPAERTAEEWAALCASQQQQIRDLTKEKYARGTDVNRMKNVVKGMGQLQDEQTADFACQMAAAHAVIASLKAIKEQYEAAASAIHALREQAALAERNEARLEALEQASRAAGRF